MHSTHLQEIQVLLEIVDWNGSDNSSSKLPILIPQSNNQCYQYDSDQRKPHVVDFRVALPRRWMRCLKG